MLPAMRAFDVVEGPTANIREIEGQFYFSGNFCTCLIVPGVSVPAMKIPFGRQRLPTLCLVQFKLVSEVTSEKLFDQRMESKIDESLIEGQNVFHHVPEGFSFLVAIEVVPAQSPQPGFENLPHSA
jgi:hypothetical protein